MIETKAFHRSQRHFFEILAQKKAPAVKQEPSSIRPSNQHKGDD
jgi:hypothetical protein